MEKDSTVLLMMVLIVICWFGIFKFSGMAALYLGETIEYAGRTIVVERVNADSAIISVDEEQDIFKKGDKKLINGIEIQVLEIIYFPEPEDRRIEINLDSTTICSDGVCDLGEDSENCCIDCGCQTDYTCENNECVYRPANKCEIDVDCDDNNLITKDLCFGEPKTCHYQTIQCDLNEDCEDNNKCTQDYCIFNACINKPVAGCETKEVPISKSVENKGFFSKLFSWLFGN